MNCTSIVAGKITWAEGGGFLWSRDHVVEAMRAGKPAKMLQQKYGFGAAMLKKMGYVEGQGLGAGGTGIVKPIEVQMRPTKMGVGAVKEREESDAEDEDVEVDFEQVVADMDEMGLGVADLVRGAAGGSKGGLKVLNGVSFVSRRKYGEEDSRRKLAKLVADYKKGTESERRLALAIMVLRLEITSIDEAKKSVGTVKGDSDVEKKLAELEKLRASGVVRSMGSGEFLDAIVYSIVVGELDKLFSEPVEDFEKVCVQIARWKQVADPEIVDSAVSQTVFDQFQAFVLENWATDQVCVAENLESLRGCLSWDLGNYIEYQVIFPRLVGEIGEFVPQIGYDVAEQTDLWQQILHGNIGQKLIELKLRRYEEYFDTTLLLAALEPDSRDITIEGYLTNLEYSQALVAKLLAELQNYHGDVFLAFVAFKKYLLVDSRVDIFEVFIGQYYIPRFQTGFFLALLRSEDSRPSEILQNCYTKLTEGISRLAGLDLSVYWNPLLRDINMCLDLYHRGKTASFQAAAAKLSNVKLASADDLIATMTKSLTSPRKTAKDVRGISSSQLVVSYKDVVEDYCARHDMIFAQLTNSLDRKFSVLKGNKKPLLVSIEHDVLYADGRPIRLAELDTLVG